MGNEKITKEKEVKLNAKSIITIEELFELIENFDFVAHEEARRHKKSRPWVRDLIAVLVPRPRGLHMDQLSRELWAMREKTLPMPKAFRETVQSRLNEHTSQSAVFWSKNKPPEDDIFYSPEGKGSGTWAVYPDKAAAWLKRKKLPPT